jgi:hypothetical protein
VQSHSRCSQTRSAAAHSHCSHADVKSCVTGIEKSICNMPVALLESISIMQLHAECLPCCSDHQYSSLKISPVCNVQSMQRYSQALSKIIQACSRLSWLRYQVYVPGFFCYGWVLQAAPTASSAIIIKTVPLTRTCSLCAQTSCPGYRALENCSATLFISKREHSASVSWQEPTDYNYTNRCKPHPIRHIVWKAYCYHYSCLGIRILLIPGW